MAGGFPLIVYRTFNCALGGMHAALDGLVLRSDDPFWDRFFTSAGSECACSAIGANSWKSAVRRGGNPFLAMPEAEPLTGGAS